jgi:hypothetical protein
MLNGQSLQNIAWGVTTLTEAVLFASLAYKRLARVLPAFSIYILSTILQSATLFVVYRLVGFNSWTAYEVGWASQGVVTALRWLAVAEIARRTMSPYRGIWRLAKWVLTGLSVAVVAASLVLWKESQFYLVGYLERGVQLAIAASIVGVFLFARHYQVRVAPLERMLGTGLFLYSCFSVVNYSVLQHELKTFTYAWNFLDILAFFASLLIWIGAVWKYADEKMRGFLPASEGANTGITTGEYEALTGQLSGRLRTLNERLSRMRDTAGPR